MTGAFDNFLYLVSVLSTGFLTVFSVKSEIREDTKPTKNVDRRLGTKNCFLNAYAWRMICAQSFARQQNQIATTLWFSLVILGKLARRANSNDLEIPCGEKSRFSKEKFLDATTSSKVNVAGCISVRGKLDSCRTAQTKRETNRRCHWKIQRWSFWISLNGLFICYCFQIICHFQTRN